MRTITLRTKPVPINQKYGVLNGRNILQKKYRDAKEALAWETRSQWQGEPLEDEVTMNVLFFLGNRRRVDIDAYLKIVLDAMEGIVYLDDYQVADMHVIRTHDFDDPRVVVQVL